MPFGSTKRILKIETQLDVQKKKCFASQSRVYFLAICAPETFEKKKKGFLLFYHYSFPLFDQRAKLSGILLLIVIWFGRDCVSVFIRVCLTSYRWFDI